MPFVNILNGIFNDIKLWIYGIIAGLTVVVIGINVVNYQKGTSSEKTDAVINIRKTLEIAAGLFVLIWFVGYIIGKFSVQVA